MQQGSPGQARGSLVAERCGPHVLVRRRDETAAPPAFLPPLPATPNELFVAVSPAAQQVPELGAELPALLGPVIHASAVVPRVLWLAVAGFGAGELPHQLSQRLGLDVVAPDVLPATAPGAGAYAGRAAGGTGWYLFRAGTRPWLFSTRYPIPSWERALPVQRLVHGPAVVEPVPAGVLMHDGRTAPEVAARIAVADRFPKLLVGGSVSPEAVSGFVQRMPEAVRRALVLVPVSAEASRYHWLAELAVRLSAPCTFNTGAVLATPGAAPTTVVLDSSGQQRFRPFATVVRQPAAGGDQEVLDVAEPPPGWQRCGPRTYRFGADNDGVVADVVPSGLVLHRVETALEANANAVALPFSPDGWVLNLGAVGEPVGDELITAAESLLRGIDPASRAVARLRVLGELGQDAAARVRTIALGAGVQVDLPSPSDTPAAVQPEPDQQPPVPLSAAAPPIVTMSAAPVSTVSGAPSRPAPPPSEPEPETSSASDEPSADAPEILPEPQDIAPEPVDAEILSDASADAEEEPAEEVDEQTAPDPGQASLVKDRKSTTGEQNRFMAAAGEAFSDALATVNAAMATWPALRRGEDPGVKADYVAVCLFLGRGEGGAEQLNSAVRSGASTALEGHLPCLVSGMRRLPTHRRPVLRQSIVPGSVEERSTPGTLLVEPGFLSASTNLDMTVPGAHVDVLIWPCKARRTSELALNRPVDEVVFLAGSRFKALAVREVAEDEDDVEDDEKPSAPRVAVLFRELAPGERSSGAELDERDLAALTKLDRALARRQRATLRMVDDPDAVARLTRSMVEATDEHRADERSLAGVGTSAGQP